MLTTIGRNPGPATAVDLLRACHQRIRHFTDVISRIAAAEGEPEADVADAAKRVNRYFTIALPLHIQDEERTILPRLTGKDAAVDAALAEMAAEHLEHEATMAEVLSLTTQVNEAPAELARFAPDLARIATTLDSFWKVHLVREEQVIFPAILRLFDERAHTEAQAEYKDRRQREGITP